MCGTWLSLTVLVLVRQHASDVKGMNLMGHPSACISVDAPFMQVVDDHHSRSSTYSHGHAPAVAAAAEAGTITDAAQLPKPLPVDPGTSTSSLVDHELPPQQLLEQLPVMHETADIAQPDGELPEQLFLDRGEADPAISRSQLPLDSGDADVAQKSIQQLPGTPAKPENDWVSLC